MFTFIISTTAGNKTVTKNEKVLLKAIQKGKVVAMEKEGFEYISARIAKSPKASWIKGLAAASLIEYTEL